MDGLNKSILLWRDWRSMGSREKNTMTVQFNITKTPGYGTYLDDAVGMPYGKTSDAVTQWQNFFGYKPCLFKNGAVVGYLNPNDYSKFEDGTTADITSGNAGDVMVEFPRRGIKISKSGSTVTVSMTKDDNVNGYSYLAHTRGSTKKDKFYIGVYLASYTKDTSYKYYLHSLSGQVVSTGSGLSAHRYWASNLGTGYMNVSFYQYLFIQCMYLLQYKGNLDSQSVHGYGFTAGSANGSALRTGFGNTSGLMYGEPVSSKSSGDYYGNRCSGHIKLFGIEDFWGLYKWHIDGYYVNSSYHILTATDGFNNTGEGYTDHGTLVGASSLNGFISDAVCNSDVGFTPTATSASLSTYFCDYGMLYNDRVPTVGGQWSELESEIGHKGIFQFRLKDTPTNNNETAGGRLAYL